MLDVRQVKLPIHQVSTISHPSSPHIALQIVALLPATHISSYNPSDSRFSECSRRTKSLFLKLVISSNSADRVQIQRVTPDLL
jgi:hypothetical protein